MARRDGTGGVPPPQDGAAPAGTGEGLAESEERFRLLVDAVRDYAIFMLDPQGYVTSWNTGAARIKGYTAQEIIGQHFSRFYTPEDAADGLPATILRTAAEEGHCQVEGWRVRKDGARFWADVTVTALRAPGGRLVGFAKVTRDLTDRHAQEESLRQSEERFRVLVEGVVDYAILMLDPQGYVTSWNAGAERIKGYTAHEILGQHFSVFHTPEDAANGKPERVLDQAIRTGRFEEEGWRVRKDGTRFWASVVVRALHDDDGKLRGFAKITRDLSERLEVEEERRRRLAAEEAAELRAEFLSVAAHELKTPVTSLRGTAELTLRRYSRGDVAPERVKQALEVIQLQCGKLTRLVEQLLDISRVEAGHLAVERQEADVGALAASVVAMFRTRSDGARIQFERPGTRVPAEIDSLRVEQVLINLLDNALKYSPAGSPVRLEVSKSKDGDETTDGVQIAVADQGPGVPPEDRPHLFDRFFRSRATNFTSGMGLGLSISREIVELHGGTIRAEFPAEGGTRFVVSLPARASQGGAGLKVVA